MLMRSRKRILICAAVIFLTAAGIIVLMFISKNTDNKYISEKLELAQKYLLELDYSNAVLEFTDAIKIDPKNPDAYIGLAEAYIGTGDTDKAVSVLKKGLSETEDERIEQLLEKYAALENSKVTEAVTSEETSAVTADSTTTVTVSETSSLTLTEAETEETVTESEEVMPVSEISENKVTDEERETAVITYNTTAVQSETVVTALETQVQTTVHIKPTAKTTAEATKVAVTSAVSKVDKDYLFVTPEMEKVKLLSGNFNAYYKSDSVYYTPPKNGYYGFIYSVKHEKSDPCLYLCKKKPYFNSGVLNNGAYYLNADNEYQVYIKERNTRDIKIKDLNYKYVAYIYIPNDPYNIEGSFKGKILFEGQHQTYYFTPNVTAKYKFKFKNTDGVKIQFTYGIKGSDNMTEYNTDKNLSLNLEAGITYEFTIISRSSNKGSYIVRIT